jgi:hypothetical protein
MHGNLLHREVDVQQPHLVRETHVNTRRHTPPPQRGNGEGGPCDFLTGGRRSASVRLQMLHPCGSERVGGSVDRWSIVIAADLSIAQCVFRGWQSAGTVHAWAEGQKAGGQYGHG